MKVVIDESVILFLRENNIKISHQIKLIITNLKKNPRMYPKIIGYEENRHIVIKGVDFGYKIDDKTIIIADCRFVKSSIKLKLR